MTDGQSIANPNLSDAMRNIAHDSRGYYVLVYQAAQDAGEGTFCSAFLPGND